MHDILKDGNFQTFWLNMLDDQGALQFDPQRHKTLAHFLASEFRGLGHFHILTTRVNQKIAALQCLEAIRIYAARHNKLPLSLDDIKSVPIPLDPMTMTSFLYELKNDIAVLSSSANQKSELPVYPLRYEIKLRN